MAVVKVAPVEKVLRARIDAALSPQARQKVIARVAREKLGEAQQQNLRVLGRVPDHETIVNGRRGVPLETAHPDRGEIVFKFELVSQVVAWIYVQLVQRSPRGPAGGAGTFREQHVILADGVQVLPSEALPAAAEIVIINTTPYARKIEIGTTKSGRPFVISAEPRLYDAVSHEAAARFSNVARISYTFRPLQGGAKIRARGGGKRDMRYPAIIIRPK
jgi:hypothetical protein